MVKIEQIDRTSTFAWNHDCLPLLATGTVAGAVDLDFNSSSCLEIWDIFSATNTKDPIFSASVDNKFYGLAWSKPFEGRPRGVLVGAFENGVIEFWDGDKLIKTKDLKQSSVFRSEKHTGDVKTLAFNPTEHHILVSGGSKGEIFVWDTKTFAEPTIPGKAMTPMDEISSVAWNNSVSHIFASTGNAGYTSIWDMKSKREVLHLAYNGELGKANFSFVKWHPTQSTKLITASDNDGCPIILTWDLRNSNAPEKILQGHKKGVLSLDWCQQDPELLISSGKDNTTILWNPITGEKLGEYPTAANWAFLTQFAPAAPDIFATASFDGKIVVQTLQDTSPPIAAETNKNEAEFWNEISTSETQQPVFDINQAPAWLKRPSSVSFGFGSKLVTIKSENGKSVVEVNKFTSQSNFSSSALTKALQSNDFGEIIDGKLGGEFIDENDKSDWELLKKLSSSDKSSVFADVINDRKEKESEEEPEQKLETTEEKEPESKPESKEPKPESESESNGNSFFDNLGEKNGSSTTKTYTPSGTFKLVGSSDSTDEKLIKLILSNKLEEAVDQCVNTGKLTEALVLALDASPVIKNKVKEAFFETKKESELSRIIYSASSKNITDIVANADVSDWKIIANSITAYCLDPQEYNQKITELGDRILEADSSNRHDAILCYLVGGAIDKISNIWLQEMPDFEQKLLKGSEKDINTPFEAHFESLNNFAEKISAYRAISNITGSLSGPSIEPICKAILEYSNLLANYGEFEMAANFSKLLPADLDGFKANNDRIIKAVGGGATPAAGSAAGGAGVGAGVGKKTGRYNQYTRNQPKIASPVTQFAQPTNQFNASSVAPPFTPSVPVGGAFGGSLKPQPPIGSRSGSGFKPSVPSTPRSQVVAPTSNPYMKPAAPSNPYAAQATPIIQNQNTIPNPYSAPNPYAGAHTAPVPTNPYMRQPSVSSPGQVAPPPQMPPKPKYKEVTDGWNDLPDTFKQAPEARRAAAAATSPAPTPFANQPTGPTGPTPPGAAGSKRPSVVSPNSAPPVGPPRVLSRTASKASLPTAAASPRPSAAAVSNRYAPPPGSTAPAPATPGPSVPGHPAPPAANPYAPTQTASPGVNAYAAPPPNPFAQQQPQFAPPPANPYATPQPPANPYATPAPAPNPYAAPPPQMNNFAPSTPGSKLTSPRAGSSQVRNPYAPPPPAAGGPPSDGARVPNGVIPPNPVVAPPPPVKGVSIPGPPPTGPISGPPPTNTFAQPPAAQPPAAQPLTQVPEVAKYPAGDRSHIAEDVKHIYDVFSAAYETLQPNIPEKYAKHGEDMEKRLGILFDHLNNDDLLTTNGKDALREVATTFEQKDYQGASALVLSFASSFPDEIGNWHTGVKRLINMTEALL